MRNITYILLALFLSIPGMPYAQQAEIDRRQSFLQAESEYQVGHIDNAINMLGDQLMSYSGTLKVSAYRLLALCYLAQDDLNGANKYVDLLLKEDPYYSISLNDPERFAELIRNKKEGKATLVTASQQAETLEEAPVPVTLITEEMIRALGGGQSLKNVLATYVPGMIVIESWNMDNIAMHGIYTAGQEKILIMLNGHRLNTRSTNTATPDYSINLDKVKQIEVLRGPASSLYGNVALTAVVNIITKEGQEIDGVESSLGIGSFDTYKANLMIGKRFMNMDILIWGSFYQSNGQQIFIPSSQSYNMYPQDGYAIIGGYNGKPSYDYGFTFKWGNFNVMLNQRYGKKISPYSFFGSTYDYQRYRKIENENPGYSTDATHADIGYNKDWDNFSLNVNMYGDIYSITDYSVISDSILSNEFDANGAPLVDENGQYILSKQSGVYQTANWREATFGAAAKLSTQYTIGENKGHLLLGGQFENFRLQDSYSLLGNQFENVVLYQSGSSSFFHSDNESILSIFLQDKHIFSSHFIVNAGLRYDHKWRVNSTINALSPRISAIYIANNLWNMKLSFAKSFVDAPYFYRQNTSNTYRGSENLMPEYMDALQFDILYKNNRLGLSYDCNFYYNALTDLIYKVNSSEITSEKYRNSGKLKMAGIENIVEYKQKRFWGNLNFSYQHVFSGYNYSLTEKKIHNIPSFTLNLTMSRNLLSRKEHNLWLHGNFTYNTKRLSPITGVFQHEIPYENMENELNDYAIVNAGVEYNWKKLRISLFCNNIFNTSYSIGGSTSIPYYQKGRNVFGQMTYVFN